MYTDTLSNLRKAKPVFYKANGRLTVYGLNCGYIEREEDDKGAQLDLYHEGVYHVKYVDSKNNILEWESYELVNDAWKKFFELKKEYNL